MKTTQDAKKLLDYAQYEEIMYEKALRQGMPSRQAREWARTQSQMQARLRQKELEEAQAKRMRKP